MDKRPASAPHHEPVWHPPLPRPRTAAAQARPMGLSETIAQMKEMISQNDMTYEEAAAATTRHMERVFMNRRVSRPASASVLSYSLRDMPSPTKGHPGPELLFTSSPHVERRSIADAFPSFRGTASQTTTRPASAANGILSAQRPASASATFRSAVLSEIPTDVRILAILEDQLHGSFDPQKLRDAVKSQTETQGCTSPLERYESFKRSIELVIPKEQFPAVNSFATALFWECDHVIEEMRWQLSNSHADISTTAMREAVAESSRATRAAEEAAQRVSDLEQVVEHFTRCNSDYAINQSRLEDALDKLRMAIATTVSSCVLSSAPEHQGTTTTGEAGLRQTALAPDAADSESYVAALTRLEGVFQSLRDENVMLSQVASDALEQHAQQSSEMAELLDRANAFQNQVGNLKGTMRVMRAYIEKLEERVLVLTDANDHSFLGDVRAAALSADTADAEVTRLLLDTSLWNVVASKPGAVDHELRYAPAGGQAADQTDAAAIVGSIREQFKPSLFRAHLGSADLNEIERDALPAHLRQLALPKLVQRPMDGLAGIVSFVEETAASYVGVLEAAVPGAYKAFDEHIWDSCMRKAQSPKAASELALTAHHMAKRYERQSGICFVYSKTSSMRLPGDFWLRYPRYMQALRERLRLCDSTSKKAKDKIPRSTFLAVVKEAWPLVRGDELTALSSATVLAASLDSTKLTEDVTYEPYFDRSTAGAAYVHDVLIRVLVSCCSRYVTRVKAECCKLIFDETKSRMQRISRGRAASRSAEVRRMMALDPSELPGVPGVVSLSEVVAAVVAVDPGIRDSDRKRILADVTLSSFYFEHPDTEPAYLQRLESNTIHVDVMELRLRRMGCHLVMPPSMTSDVSNSQVTA